MKQPETQDRLKFHGLTVDAGEYRRLSKLFDVLYGYTTDDNDDDAKKRAARLAAQLHRRLQEWGQHPGREVL